MNPWWDYPWRGILIYPQRVSYRARWTPLVFYLGDPSAMAGYVLREGD